jgi:hypothetical protein
MHAETHEDIRIKVIAKIRRELLKTIRELLNNSFLNSELQQQLEEYERIISAERDIPLIVKNEKRIEDVGIPDIELFGGRIIVEIKVMLREFTKGKIQLQSYIKASPLTKYAILTNNKNWEIYKIDNGKLKIISRDSNRIRYILRDIILQGIKLELSTKNVRNLFSSLITLENELYVIFKEYNIKNTSLFKAYKNILSKLYEGILENEEDAEKLYIKHTIIQMIVSSSLTVALEKESTPKKACLGEDIESEIALPYLKWWRNLDERFIKSLTETIYSRTLLLDWASGNKADIFRELYEILIDAETRRRLGEYYTPLWLVEYMVENLSNELKGKIVLDPFCGSGSFVVVSFYKKIAEGEDPDEAIKEVIGFDINPLSVSIARAELIIAYNTIRRGIITPLIFNTDSATLLLRPQEDWQSLSIIDELRALEKRIEYINSPLYNASQIDFSEILKIERILHDLFEKASKNPERIKEELGKIKEEKWKGSLMKIIVDALSDQDSIEILLSLIKKYGNGVWAISISSLFAPYFIRKIKADIVITNPPWRLFTEVKGSYGKILRKAAAILLERYEKRGRIVNAADIASILLYGCKKIVRNNGEIAFLMPKESVYVPGSYYGLGKILTYEVIKNLKGKIIECDIDAFQHGRPPCIIFLELKKGDIRSYHMDIRWKGKYSKALHHNDVSIDLYESESYSQYIEKTLDYLQISTDKIKKVLSVEDVIPKGEYIMGLFGGKRKTGAKQYAGLIFDVLSYDKTSGEYFIKLRNTNDPIRIPEFFLKKYWKKIVYLSQIYPFYFRSFYNILLSHNGKEDLKNFLKGELNKFSMQDRKMVQSLIEELKQPEKLSFLDKSRYYVFYRSKRTFASVVLAPHELQKISEEIVVAADCSYIVSKNKLKAYYYSAILNYLAYETIKRKFAFERNLFLRPLIAIIKSGLEWKGKEWQKEVANLSEQLQHKVLEHLKSQEDIIVRKFYNRIRQHNMTRAIFDKIITIIDKNIDKDRIDLTSVAKI